MTLCDPKDCSLPGSSIHGVSQAIILEWVAISGDLPSPGTESGSPALQEGSLPLSHLAPRASQVALAVKNLPANTGNIRDFNLGLIPRSGRSPGGGHGNPLRYSCLENPVDRGAWWATGYRVAKEVDMT